MHFNAVGWRCVRPLSRIPSWRDTSLRCSSRALYFTATSKQRMPDGQDPNVSGEGGAHKSNASVPESPKAKRTTMVSVFDLSYRGSEPCAEYNGASGRPGSQTPHSRDERKGAGWPPDSPVMSSPIFTVLKFPTFSVLRSSREKEKNPDSADCVERVRGPGKGEMKAGMSRDGAPSASAPHSPSISHEAAIKEDISAYLSARQQWEKLLPVIHLKEGELRRHRVKLDEMDWNEYHSRNFSVGIVLAFMLNTVVLFYWPFHV